MRHQIPMPREALAPEHVSHDVHVVAPDIAYVRTGIVNVVMCGVPGAGTLRWILIDAGMRGYADTIRDTSWTRFAPAHRGGPPEPMPPAAIVLTHGHFDHVGALAVLAEAWDVPIYAHPLEFPHLDGTRAYPPPNPGAGGLMSLSSPMLPRAPIDVSRYLRPLPPDGTIPGMPGWRWIHTPGHTSGHVSFWRESDRALISGDAVITTRQESAYDALAQTPEIHGPPMYFTPDWRAAGGSVRRLAALQPDLLVTGHGRAMAGPLMRAALHRLGEQFEQIAVPDNRR